jgi:PKD repeat protein
VIFKDTTATKYGRVSSWLWDFGDQKTGDSSTIQNPSYKYSDTGMKNVTLTVSNSKGCQDTVHQLIHMTDKPPIFFPFRDTLICNIDTLQLHAQGFGNFPESFRSMINPGTGSICLSQNQYLHTRLIREVVLIQILCSPA